jgi:hypothetical protein
MTKRKTDARPARSLRDRAMSRPELQLPSVARVAPAGATSYAIKAEDSAIRRMIDEALAERRTNRI